MHELRGSVESGVDCFMSGGIRALERPLREWRWALIGTPVDEPILVIRRTTSNGVMGCLPCLPASRGNADVARGFMRQRELQAAHRCKMPQGRGILKACRA